MLERNSPNRSYCAPLAATSFLTSSTASCDQATIWSASTSSASRSPAVSSLLMPPGIGARPMHALARGVADGFLAPFAQCDALARDLRICRRHRDDVAPVDLGVEAKQQIGRRQQEEMQRVRLQDLAIMHQPPHFIGAGRRRRRADDTVQRLGGGELVRHRADAA